MFPDLTPEELKNFAQSWVEMIKAGRLKECIITLNAGQTIDKVKALYDEVMDEPVPKWLCTRCGCKIVDNSCPCNCTESPRPLELL